MLWDRIGKQEAYWAGITDGELVLRRRGIYVRWVMFLKSHESALVIHQLKQFLM